MDDTASVDITHRGKSVRFELYAFQTGGQIYHEAEQALGFPLEHSLYIRNADTGETMAAVTRDDTVFDLPARTTLVPEHRLILWVFTTPDRPCKVFHRWVDEMPAFLDNFPLGHAFGRRGKVMGADYKWMPGVNQLFTHRPDGSVPDRDWRGPCVCSCDLRNAPNECPTAESN
jgi:hypothetical protein